MLEGKVAIVSGASYGMGTSMAELFASEGAKVVLTARGKEKLDAVVDDLKAKGYEVNIGVITCQLEKISKLEGSFDVRIELAE